MPKPINSHCSHCGAEFESPEGYPRSCTNAECGALTWANPVPVAVVLIPVEHAGRTGLLVIRRGIEPRIGQLAVVGGFVDAEESWQAAGAREVLEETQVIIAAEELTPFWFTSTEPRPNRVLLFASSLLALQSAALPEFEPTDETTERGLVFGPGGLDEVFAFPLHAEAARRWFAKRKLDGPHDFTAV